MKDVDAVVVLSGGLDSSVALGLAIREFGAERVGAVSFDYNQRHVRELEAALSITRHYHIPRKKHLILSDIPLAESLLSAESSEDIPDISYADIKGVSPSYVPYRNGTFLSIAASWAAKAGAKALYAGMHAEDAQNWAYPDCTPEFLGAMANAIYIGTYHQVRLHTPLMWMMKQDIVTIGEYLGVPMHLTWSCYAGGEKHCGTCPTCRARKEAFAKANVVDPTLYVK